MGGKGADVYNSKYDQPVDELMNAIYTGALTGQAVSPSPALIGPSIAQQIGGKYNAETGQVEAPDGTKYSFDPTTNSMVQAGGGAGLPSDIVQAENGLYQSKRDGTLYDSEGYRVRADGIRLSNAPMISVNMQGSGQYGDLVNQAYSDLSQGTFDNPNSAWSQLGQVFNKSAYDPTTGQYKTLGPDDTAPAQRTSDYYMGDGQGDFFNSDYSATSYKPFDYNSPEVYSLTPVSNKVWDNKTEHMNRASQNNYEGAKQDWGDWVGAQGSSLSSGRMLGGQQDLQRQRDIEQQQNRSDIQTEKALQEYSAAKDQRDQQLGYDFKTQGLNAGESRYAQDQALDEKKYGYEDEYNRAFQKLQTREALDSGAQDRAYQESQGSKQDLMNMLTYFNDLMRVYAGQDANAVNLAAAKSQALGGALGGLAGGAGALGGGWASRPSRPS